VVQKGVLFAGCKIFNHLPNEIKEVFADAKLFKSELKTYLLEQSFYSLDEFYRSKHH
jgi:hypothetical protein